MSSPAGERAIEDALRAGNAILKFVSPNDAGVTGSHQSGFYLPRAAWQMFTPHPPVKGVNTDEIVHIAWPDGRNTESRIVWYGKGTRAEYRLTRFGPDFPFLDERRVGDLFVLIPHDHHRFTAWVLDLDEDIEELLAALGVEPFEHWGVYRHGVPVVESEDACFDRRCREFAAPLREFPSGEAFSAQTRQILEQCLPGFARLSADAALMRAMEAEYGLFRVVERQICQPDFGRAFRDVDDFLQTAARLMNRRKARAGRSLENHVEHVLRAAGMPHEMRPDIDGKPDVVIPSAAAYHDDSYPVDRLVIVGIKTTCKDRWRQVLNEGRRVPRKHILTTQPGISSNQLAEMHDAQVTLVVPERLHRDYPRNRQIELLSVETFVEQVRQLLSEAPAAIGDRRLF